MSYKIMFIGFLALFCQDVFAQNKCKCNHPKKTEIDLLYDAMPEFFINYNLLPQETQTLLWDDAKTLACRAVIQVKPNIGDCMLEDIVQPIYNCLVAIALSEFTEVEQIKGIRIHENESLNAGTDIKLKIIGPNDDFLFSFEQVQCAYTFLVTSSGEVSYQGTIVHNLQD